MIPITRPMMDEREAEAARRVILSGWVTQGPEVAAFEGEFAAHCGAPHACAVSSCTTGLHLALLAVGVGPDSEVITVSHSYIATANAIRHCGATPVFVDITADTFNIDAALVEGAITARTRAILVVHQMGMPCDLSVLVPIARQHGVAIVEDAACAAGSMLRWNDRWEPVGAPHADLAVFSFHPRKVMSTGDGGMVTTANPAWDQTMRSLRQHAMSLPDTVRHHAGTVAFETYPTVGYNYRMTDIQAAVGRVQLSRLPEIVAARRRLAERYRTLLDGIEGLMLPHEPAWARSNWQSYCVRLPSGVAQRAVMQRLLDDGVATRRGIMCAHREPAYADRMPRHPLPVSEMAQDTGILLPLFPQMSHDDQQMVASTLARAIAAARA